MLHAAAICCLSAALAAGPTGPEAAASRRAPAVATTLQEARARADALVGRFGDGYAARFDTRRKLAYVTVWDAAALGFAMRMVAAHVDAHRRGLFPKPLESYVTILLPTVRHYRAFLDKAHPEASGLYVGRERTLASISLSSTLLHELVHALHHNDQIAAGQQHPIWLTEGLASFYEMAQARDGVLMSRMGPDLEDLQEQMRQGKYYPLASFLTLDQKEFLSKPQLAYSQARYLIYFLHDKSLVEEFYATYKAGYDDDPTGRKALEEVLGDDLPRVEADWREWVLAQKPPWQSVLRVVAHLGVRMREEEEGVLVEKILPRTAARRGGVLEVGDVILSIGGEATPRPRVLTRVVRMFRPGQTVQIELIRRGERVVVQQMLGSVRTRD